MSSDVTDNILTLLASSWRRLLAARAAALDEYTKLDSEYLAKSSMRDDDYRGVTAERVGDAIKVEAFGVRLKVRCQPRYREEDPQSDQEEIGCLEWCLWPDKAATEDQKALATMPVTASMSDSPDRQVLRAKLVEALKKALMPKDWR